MEPLTHAQNEVRLYPRRADMDKIRHVLRSDISNQYYLVFGEVGSGKTRIITEVVRNMAATSGKRREGAPVYVLASQGHSFPESFGSAVDFHYDEHISLRFVMDYIFRVGQLPERDNRSKLERLLNAIERAAFRYLERTGKPAVLVIDGLDWLNDSMPEAIGLLQEKAKLWADTHIVKMVFVTNDEKTEEVMQRNHSAWSRAALPIVIGDLSPDEARQFLRLHDPIMTKATLECRKRRCKGHHHGDEENGQKNNTETNGNKHNGNGNGNGGGHGGNDSVRNNGGNGDEEQAVMPDAHMDQVIDLVGGRVQNLLVCKRDWLKGSPFHYTSNHLRLKERSKFIEIAKKAERRRVIELVYAAPARRVLLADLIDLTSREDVFFCAYHNVIRIERDDAAGLMVHFESRLTERVVEEMYREEGGAGRGWAWEQLAALTRWASSYFTSKG